MQHILGRDTERTSSICERKQMGHITKTEKERNLEEREGSLPSTSLLVFWISQLMAISFITMTEPSSVPKSMADEKIGGDLLLHQDSIYTSSFLPTR